MRWRCAAWLALLAAVSCSSKETILEPEIDDPIDGLSLTASVVEIDGTEDTGSRVKMVSVRVVLSNKSETDVEHSYPAGCPVRMRLYNMTTDALVYDQTATGCAVSSVVGFRLAPAASKTFASGPRFPWEVAGDSIPPDTYRATAVLRITGENPIELEAGTYRIPVCIIEGIRPVCS